MLLKRQVLGHWSLDETEFPHSMIPDGGLHVKTRKKEMVIWIFWGTVCRRKEFLRIPLDHHLFSRYWHTKYEKYTSTQMPP